MKQAETAAVARNAVIYARYSSHNQTEQSIEGQLRVCHEYAQREGFTIVGEYIDRAISGKTDDRPDFQRMVSDSRKRAFQYVIVYKCKFVKQIGQGTQQGSASQAVSSVSCWSGDYEQRAVCESQPERRKSGQNKSVSDLPGGCVPPYHYVWECKDGSVYAGCPTQRKKKKKG